MLTKKIIIHCGMHKTGSSALQVQLAQSRDSFLKYGYDYLAVGGVKAAKEGRITAGNGVELARAYLPPGHRSSQVESRIAVTKKIRRAIAATKHNVILSSEFFSHISHKDFGELVMALSDLGKVQLVFFVREQVNAMASGYIQSVKRSIQTTKFPDEFFANLDLTKRPRMAYNTHFKRLTVAVGEGTILVKPYELSKMHPAGLMGLFLEMIDADVPIESLPADSHINLSPSPQEVRLMIEFNKYRPRVHFSDMLVEASYLAGRSKIFSNHAILPPELVSRIRNAFAAENESFFTNFAKCENIYRQTDKDVGFIDLREVTFDATDVMNILLGVMVKMDHRIAKLESD